MPPTHDLSQEAGISSATHNGEELYSDTIEVQTPHAHPSPELHGVDNFDGTAASTPLSAPPPSDIFPNDGTNSFDPPSRLTNSPVQSTHSPVDLARGPSISSKQPSPHSDHVPRSAESPSVALLRPQTDSAFPTAAVSTPPTTGYFSTMRMTLPAPHSAPPHESTTSSRRVKQYTLPNGAVVSGKGLGRGRPGIKRGPRHPKADEDGRSVSTPGSMSASTLGGSSLNTAGPSKRRRTESDGLKFESATPDSESMFSSRDSSPEYNPTGETRSGRKTVKPLVSQTPVAESASPASKRPKLEGRNTAPIVSPAVKTHPKIKRRMYRGREQLALCEHCQRGHGPTGNSIVFCDACNRCWHQRCHEPQVPQSVIADTKADWYCANCEKILNGKKGKKSKAPVSSAPATNQGAQFVGPLVGGAALSPAHKLAFLQSRTKEQLISLILSGSDLAPALPLFQAPAPQLPQAQFKSDYITPASSTPGYLTAAVAADAEDEGYDSYFDEHAALYPKPGNGVKLPPESADVHMLLEHPQSRTFSHWIRGMPTREFSGNADIVFNR